MARPTIYQVHIDKPLTRLAIAWRGQGYVGGEIFPYFKVDKRTDLIWKIPRTVMSGAEGASKTGFERVRAATGQSKSLGGFVPSTQTYRVEEFALNDIVHPDVVEEADAGLQVRRTINDQLTESLSRDREFRAMKLATTSGNYAAGHVATAPTTKWGTTSAIITTEIDAGKLAMRKATLGRATDMKITVLINYATWLAVKENADLKARVQYVMATTASDIDVALLARYWQVGRVIVAGNYYNAANPGATESLSEIWPDSVVMFYNERPSKQYLGFGQTYTTRGGGFETVTWRDPSRKNAEIIELGNYSDEAIVNNFAGYLIPDVLA